MNREIKFRVISKGKNVGIERLTETGWEWMYYDLNPDKGERWCKGVMEGMSEVKRDQFTGHKDKNGEEIYEWDIIKFFDKIVAIIVFESFGGWCFKWIDPTYISIRQYNPEPIFRNISLFEVVGNVHENPEILNPTKEESSK